MKLLLLAALFAVCSAVYLPGNRQIYFGGEDRAFIHGLYGKQYAFQQYPGQKYLDIVINGVDTPMKKIRIDGETCEIINLEGLPQWYGQTYHQKYFLPNTYQYNHFFNVLKNYQGYVGEYQYQTLLGNIKEQVENGKICDFIYHLLTCLDQMVNEDLVETYYKIKQQVGHVYPTTTGFYGQELPQALRETIVPGYGYKYGYPWGTVGQTFAYPKPYTTPFGMSVFGGLKTDLKDYLVGDSYKRDIFGKWSPEAYYRYGLGGKVNEYDY